MNRVLRGIFGGFRVLSWPGRRRREEAREEPAPQDAEQLARREAEDLARRDADQLGRLLLAYEQARSSGDDVSLRALRPALIAWRLRIVDLLEADSVERWPAARGPR